MVKYQAQIIKNGGEYSFSQEAINALVDQLPGKPVLLDYDPSKQVGSVTSARKDGEYLVADFECDAEISKLFAGPGFSVGAYNIDDDAESITYEEVDAYCLGVFDKHSDDVKPVSKI